MKFQNKIMKRFVFSARMFGSVIFSLIRKMFCVWSKPRIFLSSTFLDLIDERRTVIALLISDGFDVIRMEECPELTDPLEIIAWSQRQAVKADICIFMLSYTRGTVPEAQNISWSYTEYELPHSFLYSFPMCYVLNRPFYDASRLVLDNSIEEYIRKLQALLDMTRAGLEGSPEELTSLKKEIARIKAEARTADLAAESGCQQDNDPSQAEERVHSLLNWKMWARAGPGDDSLPHSKLYPEPPFTDLERAEYFVMSRSAEKNPIPTAEADDQRSLFMFMTRLRAHCSIFRRVDSVRRLAFNILRDTEIHAYWLQQVRLRRLIRFSLLIVTGALLLGILLLYIKFVN